MSRKHTIILSTLNARYIHAALGLRYLLANMQELHNQTQLLEFTIDKRPVDIVEEILKHNPVIVGFSVYIWNTEETHHVVNLLKNISPDTKIILGGPEVSYETDKQEIVSHADYTITGQADLAFTQLCRDILNNKAPLQKIIKPENFTLDEIQFPYDEYTDEDIRNRVIYIEASRGCPFKCEFCLSSLDKTVYPFNLSKFLTEIQKLYDKGVRSFKFIDRTFNLKIDSSIKIMSFFLEKIPHEDIYLHFELIPDHLPEKLKKIIAQFPEHSLQFEIGIQSFSPEVQKNISRKQDNIKTTENLTWLRNNSHAYIHADLIIGLPGEDIHEFAKGFDQLVQLNPHEIQVGILKRLRGTPVIRHTEKFKMLYNDTAPYEVLSTSHINFSTMQDLKRFARYWDIIANSGRFKNSKNIILGKTPFDNFYKLSKWLHIESKQTHNIALPRLFTLLYKAMTDVLMLDNKVVIDVLTRDYEASGIKGLPKFLKDNHVTKQASNKRRSELRQSRHRH